MQIWQGTAKAKKNREIGVSAMNAFVQQHSSTGSGIRTGAHSGTDSAVEGEGGVVAVVDALRIYVTHVQLHSAVALRRNELVGPRAAAQRFTPCQALKNEYQALSFVGRKFQTADYDDTGSIADG